MSFANAGRSSNYPPNLPEPPPMPPGYSYGQRAWQSGSWSFGGNVGGMNAGAPWGGPAAAAWATQGAGNAGQYATMGQWPRKPPPNPGSAEYWATELKPNPLGLHNMHIRYV